MLDMPVPRGDLEDEKGFGVLISLASRVAEVITCDDNLSWPGAAAMITDTVCGCFGLMQGGWI
jgi:hypothetical protein